MKVHQEARPGPTFWRTYDCSPQRVIMQSSMMPPSGVRRTLKVDPYASSELLGTGSEAREAGRSDDRNASDPGPEKLQVALGSALPSLPAEAFGSLEIRRT